MAAFEVVARKSVNTFVGFFGKITSFRSFDRGLAGLDEVEKDKKFSFVLHCNFRRRDAIRVQDTVLFVISVSLLLNTVLKLQKLTWKRNSKLEQDLVNREKECEMKEEMTVGGEGLRH